jgi:two-component system, cell cycle response regulator
MSTEHDEPSTTTGYVGGPRLTKSEVIPTLVIIAGNAGVGRIFRIEATHTLIGRAKTCQICIEDDTISRQHARIDRIGDDLQVVDLDSRNGTFVSDQRIKVVMLKDGDKLQIGSMTIMKFSYRDSLDEAVQRNLYESATRDPLTGINNRKAFAESLEKELLFAQRRKAPLSLVLLDIDHFKQVNDQYGHLTGDQVLTHVAKVISGTVRGHDVFARWGGEEFTIMLRECRLENAIEAAERVRLLVQNARTEGGIAVTVSLGVASFGGTGPMTVATMMAEADEQLYKAKEAGRNRVSPKLQ